MASTESAGGGRDRVLAEGPLWKLSDTLRMWRPRYAVLTVFTARTPVLRYWKSSHERWGASGPRGSLYPQMARESSALTGDSAPGADAEPATRDARGGDAPAHALPLRRGRGPRELVFLAAPATSVAAREYRLRVPTEDHIVYWISAFKAAGSSMGADASGGAGRVSIGPATAHAAHATDPVGPSPPVRTSEGNRVGARAESAASPASSAVEPASAGAAACNASADSHAPGPCPPGANATRAALRVLLYRARACASRARVEACFQRWRAVAVEGRTRDVGAGESGACRAHDAGCLGADGPWLDTSPRIVPSVPRLPTQPLGPAAPSQRGRAGAAPPRSSASSGGSPLHGPTTAAGTPSAPVTPRRQGSGSLFAVGDWRSTSPSSSETGHGSPTPVRSSDAGRDATDPSVGPVARGRGRGDRGVGGDEVAKGVEGGGGGGRGALGLASPALHSQAESLNGSEGGDTEGGTWRQWCDAKPSEYGASGTHLAGSHASSPYTVGSDPDAEGNVFV